QGAALGDRRLERPEQVWRPEADVLDAFAALLEKLAPLARLARDRLDEHEGEARPGTPAVGDAQRDAGLRVAEVPVVEGEHTLIAVHDRVQIPHDDPDVERDDVWWCAHDGSPPRRQRALRGFPQVPRYGEQPVVAGRGCQVPPEPQAHGRQCAVSDAAISSIAAPMLTAAAPSVPRQASHGSTQLSCPALTTPPPLPCSAARPASVAPRDP